MFSVHYPDGRNAGNASLSFLLGLSGYCSGNTEEELAWFSELEKHLNESLCMAAQPLLQSFYGGDWDYSEDEYEIFRQNSPETEIGPEEFVETLRAVKHKWVPVSTVIASVGTLLGALRSTSPGASSWYEPGLTEAALEAMLSALISARDGKANNVRVKFY